MYVHVCVYQKRCMRVGRRDSFSTSPCLSLTHSLTQSPCGAAEPLSHLQAELVGVFAALNGREVDGIVADMTVAEGAHFIRRMVNRWFGRNMYPPEEWDPTEDWNAD
jgi:hypothetical protein